MQTFLTLALAAAAALIGTASAAPIVPVQPGGVGNLITTANNTVNATNIAPTTNLGDTTALNATIVPVPGAAGQLKLSLVNNLDSDETVNAYVTGLNEDNKLVILRPDGSFFLPTVTSNQKTPQSITAKVAIPLKGKGQTTSVTLPGYISAARVWFAVGELSFFAVAGANGAPSLVEPSAVNPKDPSADVNWGFVELTNTKQGGLYANISYVDFVGLVLGMKLTVSGGNAVQASAGLQSTAVNSICDALEKQASSDGQPWNKLCLSGTNGKPLRVMAPGDYIATNPDAFSDYFSDYVDQVWSHYTSNTLTIHTQAAAGDVACKVTGNTLNCAGDNRGYAKPSAADIFGCNSGPFGILGTDNDVHRAVVPRLCAAFDRSTLLINGGNVQPSVSSKSYYTASPTNYYSKFVHQFEVDGTGYAFAYDDVNPDDDTNQSGVVASANPQVLTVTIGGPGS
ncbi:MAG: hypothetical protein Q9160_005088 [Pyrenula sp. 1 TL-2023]